MISKEKLALSQAQAPSLYHFHQLYKPLVDAWLHFDSDTFIPQLIDWGEE